MNQTHTERIAGNVRAEVAKQRVSQGAIAERLGLSQPGVSRRLRGRTPFTASQLVELARLLNVSVSQLLDEDQAVSA